MELVFDDVVPPILEKDVNLTWCDVYLCAKATLGGTHMFDIKRIIDRPEFEADSDLDEDDIEPVKTVDIVEPEFYVYPIDSVFNQWAAKASTLEEAKQAAREKAAFYVAGVNRWYKILNPA